MQAELNPTESSAVIPSPIDAVPEIIELNRPVVGWGHKKDKDKKKEEEAKPTPVKDIYHEKTE